MQYRYDIKQQLGAGGMGAVYHAYDRLHKTDIAFKRLHIQSDAHQSQTMDVSLQTAMTIEFQILSSLRHPYIVSVRDFGFIARDEPYFTMDLIAQPQTIFDYASQLDFEQKTRTLIEFAQALSYLHRHNIVHRDLKPDNVLVAEDGHVRVVDFGLAKMENQSQEMSGTLRYIAPETIQQMPTTRASDYFALGIMAFEIYSGRYPFDLQSDSISFLLAAILNDTPDLSLLDTPQEIIDIIERLLEKDPFDRPSDIHEFIGTLSSAIGIDSVQESIELRDSFIQAAQFVGRESELKQLTSNFEDVIAGRGRMMLVGGILGIGKTRLLNELRILALVQGFVVLRGQGLESTVVPFQLWRNIARHLVLLTPDISDIEASILRDIVPDISELIGRDVKLASPLEGEAYRERLADIIIDLFVRQTSPIMLILENLQWSTTDFIVLDKLAPLLDELPLYIVGSYRNDVRSNLDERFTIAQHIRLQGLNRDAIAELGRAILTYMDTSLLDTLQEQTGGNALFLVEFVRALAEKAGSLRDVAYFIIPENLMITGIDALLQERLKRLPSWAMPLLHCVAIAGLSIDTKLVEQLSTLLPKTHNLDEWYLLCADFVILEMREEEWHFTHNQLRDSLKVLRDEQQTIDYHQRVASEIEILHGSDETYSLQLAALWRDAKDRRKESTYLPNAIDQAANKIADFEMARTLAERGVEIAESDETRNLFKRLLAECWIKLGDSEQARLLLNPILTESKENLLSIHFLLGESYYNEAHYDDAYHHFQTSLSEAQSTNDVPRIAKLYHRLGRVAGDRYQYEEAQAHYENAISLLRTLDEPYALADALLGIGHINIVQNQFSSGQPYVDEALNIHEQLQNRYGIATAQRELGVIAASIGDLDTAQTHFEAALDIRHTIRGDKRGMAYEMTNLAGVFLEKGSFLQALFYYEESLKLARSINARAIMVYALDNIGMLQVETGDYTTAQENYTLAFNLASELGDLASKATSQTGLGLVQTLTGLYDEAILTLRASGRQIHQLKDDWSIINNLLSLGITSWLQQQPNRATRLLRQSQHFAQKNNDLLGQIAALYWQGRVLVQTGDIQSALRIYQQALTDAAPLGSDPLRASLLAQKAHLNLKQMQIMEVPQDLEDAIHIAYDGDALPRLLEILSICLRYLILIGGASEPQLATWYTSIVQHEAYSVAFIDPISQFATADVSASRMDIVDVMYEIQTALS